MLFASGAALFSGDYQVSFLGRQEADALHNRSVP